MSGALKALTMSHNVPFDHLPSYKSTWELEIKPSTVFGMPLCMIIAHSIENCQENKNGDPIKLGVSVFSAPVPALTGVR